MSPSSVKRNKALELCTIMQTANISIAPANREQRIAGKKMLMG